MSTSTPLLDSLLKRGELRQALELARAQLAHHAEPDLLLLAFGLEVRVHEFDHAATTLARLIELAPQAKGGLEAYGRYARAEKRRVERLTDPEAAGNRSAILAPPPHVLSYSAAAVAHARGEHAAATAALEEANAARPRMSGTLVRHSGATVRFIDLIDLDALTGAVLPCFGGDALLDVPYSQLRNVKFHPGQTALDALWLPTELLFTDGTAARVRVPSLYTGSGLSAIAGTRTGNTTMFFYETGYAIGAGQRDLELHTEDGARTMVGITAIAELQLDPATARSN